MPQRILVLNPNSTRSVTDQMSAAVDAYRLAGGPQIACETLDAGPPGIETQAQVDAATGQLLDWFAERPDRREADAIVIGCFSDPGLIALREVFRQPVLGIGECAYALAASVGDRFATIAIVPGSLARHRRKARAMGLEHRYAGGLSVDLGIAGLGDEALAWTRLERCGRRLRDEAGVDSLILGCAGFSRHRGRLEDALGVRVIDPTQAAVGAAMTLLLAGHASGVPRRPRAA